MVGLCFSWADAGRCVTQPADPVSAFTVSSYLDDYIVCGCSSGGSLRLVVGVCPSTANAIWPYLCGVVGAWGTVLWLILIIGLQLSFDEQGKFELQSMTMLLFFAVLGGLCAVLLGLFFLPQEPEEIEQMERPEQLKRRRKSSSWYLD